MKTFKKRVFSGAVCEQYIYRAQDNVKRIKSTEPYVRFKTDEERIEHREAMAKRAHAQKFNAAFNPKALYSTLTFNNDEEIHTFKEARRLRDNFCRRLCREYPKAVLFIYMGRGKHTQRIHFHMVSSGVKEEEIRKQWFYGEIIRIENLKRRNYDTLGHDIGQDYTGLANYLFEHWMPEQGGHHYKSTRNAPKPEAEKPTVPKTIYGDKKAPPAPRGYRLTESRATKYGFLYYKYVFIQEPEGIQSGIL